MNVERLTLLADSLAKFDSFSNLKFNIDIWIKPATWSLFKASKVKHTKLIARRMMKSKISPDSNHGVCPMAFACLIPELQRQGLHLVETDYYTWGVIPHFEGLFHLHAIEKFFELTPLQDWQIFSKDFYNAGRNTTSTHVATKIRKMIGEQDERRTTGTDGCKDGNAAQVTAASHVV